MIKGIIMILIWHSIQAAINSNQRMAISLWGVFWYASGRKRKKVLGTPLLDKILLILNFDS